MEVEGSSESKRWACHQFLLFLVPLYLLSLGLGLMLSVKYATKRGNTEDFANLTWLTGAFFSQWVKNIETNEYARSLKADGSEIYSVQRVLQVFRKPSSTRLKVKHRKSKQKSLNVSMLIIKYVKSQRREKKITSIQRLACFYSLGKRGPVWCDVLFIWRCSPSSTQHLFWEQALWFSFEWLARKYCSVIGD